MARMHDAEDELLGSLNTTVRGNSPDASLYSRLDTGGPLAPKFGPEEVIPGLSCSYGALAYSYSTPPSDISQHSRRAGCHNPVETPDERHHCGDCGGDYCTIHAEPAAHDCESVILPLGRRRH